MSRLELETFIVGHSYPNADGSDRSEEFWLCDVGEKLALIREQKNEFDRNAIAVFRTTGMQIGYLPKDVAKNIAKHIDRGHHATAEVLELIDSEHQRCMYRDVRIRVSLS